MIAYLYRWRVKAGQEQDFQAAWSAVTEALGKHGSLGSALFRADDGTTYALARWPDDEARTKAFDSDVAVNAVQAMREAIAETFDPVRLTEVENLWKQPL